VSQQNESQCKVPEGGEGLVYLRSNKEHTGQKQREKRGESWELQGSRVWELVKIRCALQAIVMSLVFSLREAEDFEQKVI
jgi:hypothetical protein